MDTYEIKKRIKNKEGICFYTEGYYMSVLIEKILLDNKYIWKGNPIGKSILNTVDRNNSVFDNIWFYIDFDFNEEMVIAFSIGRIKNTVNPKHVIKTHKFSAQELNDLFIIVPDYKPKKIERTL